jgi:hypothetical protein
LLVYKTGDAGLWMLTEKVRCNPIAESARSTNHIDASIASLCHKLFIRSFVDPPFRLIRIIFHYQRVNQLAQFDW